MSRKPEQALSARKIRDQGKNNRKEFDQALSGSHEQVFGPTPRQIGGSFSQEQTAAENTGDDPGHDPANALEELRTLLGLCQALRQEVIARAFHQDLNMARRELSACLMGAAMAIDLRIPAQKLRDLAESSLVFRDRPHLYQPHWSEENMGSLLPDPDDLSSLRKWIEQRIEPGDSCREALACGWLLARWLPRDQTTLRLARQIAR